MLPQRWISRIHSKNTLPPSTRLHTVFATRGEETKCLNSCYWNILPFATWAEFFKQNSSVVLTWNAPNVGGNKSHRCHFACLTFTHVIRRVHSLSTGPIPRRRWWRLSADREPKGTDEGWNLCGEPSGKASAPAALLLPSTTQWGQRVGAAAAGRRMTTNT